MDPNKTQSAVCSSYKRGFASNRRTLETAKVFSLTLTKLTRARSWAFASLYGRLAWIDSRRGALPTRETSAAATVTPRGSTQARAKPRRVLYKKSLHNRNPLEHDHTPFDYRRHHRWQTNVMLFKHVMHSPHKRVLGTKS